MDDPRDALIGEIVQRLAKIERRVDRLVKPEVGGWTLISETVLTSTAASVTFSSIPTYYRALIFLNQTRSDVAGEGEAVYWRANGDSGNNYDTAYGLFWGDNTRGSGQATATNRARAGWGEAANSRASNFGGAMTWFPGYALTDREKWSLTCVSASMGDVSAAADFQLGMTSGRWRSTAAITSITFLPDVGPNFVAGSRFVLYGLF